MNCQERIIAALTNESELDRLPTFVQQSMPEFRAKAYQYFQSHNIAIPESEKLIAGDLDFMLLPIFGFDSCLAGGDSALMPAYDDLIVEESSDGSQFLDFYGRIMLIDGQHGMRNVWYLDGTLTTEEAWNAWTHLYPRPLKSAYFANIDQIMTLGQAIGFLPIPICQELFAKITEMMTFGKFAYHLRQHPTFLNAALDQLLECKLDVINQYLNHGIKVIAVADDIGGKNAPLLSPGVYRTFFVPRLRQLTEKAHSGGASIFLHTDGDITDMMPSIITSGFDGIECLEGAAGVDILSLKKTYGDQITFIGNLDVSHTLAFQTPEKVAEETQFLLEQLKPQKRYIFAPCADIFGSIPVENLLAIKPVLDNFSYY